MKRIFTLACILLLGLPMTAQVNFLSSEYSVSESDLSKTDIYIKGRFKNEGKNVRHLKWSRDLSNFARLWETWVCDTLSCYDKGVDGTPTENHIMTVEGESELPLDVHINPLGECGEGTVVINLYDADNPDLIIASVEYYFAIGDLTNCSNIVGIDDLNLDPISVVPNPAHNYFTLKGIQSAQIEIFNALGVSALRQTITSGQEVDVTSLNRGVYFLKITQQNGRIQTKRIYVE